MEKYMEKQTPKTNILSIVPLRGKVAFPGTLISFEVGRDITLKAIDRASAAADRLLFICAQRDTEKDEITAEDIYTVGTVARTASGRHPARTRGGRLPRPRAFRSV